MAEVALRDYLVEINTLIERNSLDTAIQHCRHILGVYPKYVEVYRLLGKALLEKEAYDDAADVFQRVLSVDPEDFVARVGLSIIAERRDQLDKAIYQMERAYDLVPHNDIIQGELRHLYARRDGDVPSRLTLTRGAVARMYAQGDLYAEAEHALRDLLREQPDRLDLQVLLAEVFWRSDRRVEAADWARRALDQLPYCLNANLILGAILRAAGDGDSDQFIKRAQAVDPDNARAARLFGADSPLPPRAVEVTRWEPPSYGELLSAGEAEAAEQVPDWLRGISELSAPADLLEAPESAVNPPLPAGLHMPGAEPPRGEIPDWLQGLTVAPEEAPVEPGGEVPAWLSGLGTGPLADAAGSRAETEAPSAAPPHSTQDEEVPDWIKQLGTGTLPPPPNEPPAPSAEAAPDWLKQLGTGLLEQEPAEQSVIPIEDDTPDWLKQLGATGRLQQTTAQPEDALPDWLSNLRSQPDQAGLSEPEAAPQPESSLGASLAQSVGEAAAGAVGLAGAGLAALARDRATDEPVVEDSTRAEAPTTGELANPPEEMTMAQPPNPIDSSSPSAMPSADDALAFLASLAAGKEEQLRAEAEQEGEARMAAIMGRKPEPVVEPAPAAQPAPVIEPPVEAAPEAAQAAAILEGDISPDDALAFLARLSAGKEDQLRAEAEAEGEARMAAIMGRKTEPHPAEPPAEPVAAELPSGQTEPIEMAREPEAVVTELEPVEAERLELEPLEFEPLESAEVAAPTADDWLAQLAATGTPQSTPEEELPEWLRAMRPAEPPAEVDAEMGVQAEPEAASPAEAERILAGLIMPEVESEAELPVLEEEPPVVGTEEAPVLGELPDWLRAMQPETPAAVAAPDELPDWLRAMQPPSPAEAPAPEPVAVVEDALAEPEAASAEAVSEPVLTAIEPAMPVSVEATPAAAAEVESARPEMGAPISWWVQSAQDEDEAPLTELPAPLPVAAPSAARPRDTGRLVPGETRRATGPLPAAADVNIDPLLQQLQADKYNHGVRLELARAWWSMGNRESALEEYGKLINPARVENLSDEELDEVMFADPGPLADDIVVDLERIAEIDEQPAWLRLLGDMHMKTGNLPGALDAYRRALSHL